MNNKGKKVCFKSIWIAHLLVAAIGIIAITVYGQQQDSVARQNKVATVSDTNDVQHWQAVVDQWSSELDSVKRKLSWDRAPTDTAHIDSILFFLKTKKEEIGTLRASIQTAKVNLIAYSKRPFPLDTAGILDVSINDSTRLRFGKIQDTIERIESSLTLLMDDIVYLESSTLRQREELVVAQDTNAQGATIPVRMGKTLRKNLVKDGAMVTYFDYPSWNSRIFLILCSLLYFYWMYRLGRKSRHEEEELRLHKNEPLWIPLLKCCIFFLVLLPFTSLSVPVWVLEASYFFIFIFLYIILYPELSLLKRKALGLIFVYYVALILANLLLSEIGWTRAVAIIVNIAGIVLLWIMGRRTDVENPVGYIPRYARWALMICNVLSILLNSTGFLAMARMWSLVGGIGLLQAMSLRAFRDMLLHDLENQYERAREDSMIRRFDIKRLLNSFDRLLYVCCAALIIFVLLNNLHLMREAIIWVNRILDAEHKIGGISFTYGNLLVAVVVIWFANWLQRNLKNLLSTPSSNEMQAQKMTLFPLFRMLIVIIGFLIAVSVLGLGMDKLTVIIGALSVGIGLGLQNIINNFVSGVILVFEKPFKIGDYVELADKKGQVMQIGIRSSTLLTDQGARVIIPNGDLLSGRLVNWTFSDADIRLNMQLTVNNLVSIEEFKEWVKRKLSSYDEVDRTIPLKVWTKDITTDAYQISIQVGIRHVQYIERFRSRFLEEVKHDWEKKEVKITSS
ncbi:mechanosensitive ion channel [Sphingobacterium sp. SGG-5]|uniref:mechanosensitive ion channel family protein n=1 Tax=Sphingobacterium sp. SGG-5 TaxID=2710881 RepID=UPI0013EDC8CA|nr:mechanosensitive ion channel domain-containing protein [Sphingobacterium sp. SGG-5]NGM61031.1 mechanosensitive ion channel [Sphingobacterium sp. SGG-5]